MTEIGNSKAWWTSKTIWFALVTGVLAALNAAEPTIKDPSTLSMIGVGISVLTWILRLVTTQRIDGNKDGK